MDQLFNSRSVRISSTFCAHVLLDAHHFPIVFSVSTKTQVIIDGYCTPGTERDTYLPVSDLIRQMNGADIDMALIAPEDRELAVNNIEGNDRILDAAAQYPDRLVPSCGINPWYGSNAVRELERCVELGARMLVLSPAIQGFIPTDDVADELLQCAARLRVPVYFHTGSHGSGGPTQVVLVAEKHASTNFIMGHCGSTDYAWDMPGILEHHLLENVWFELSFVRPWIAPSYIEAAGSERFIWGSSSPRNCPTFELQQLDRHLPVDHHPDIYGGNLAKLIGD